MYSKKNSQKNNKPKLTQNSMLVKGRNRHFKVSDVYQFVDRKVTLSVTTTANRFGLFTELLNLLGTVPSMGQAVLFNGSVEWRARIYVHHIEVRILVVGSQSNTLVAGDIYNNVRTLCYETRDGTGVVPTPVLTGVVDPLDTIDARFIHLDHMFNLMTQAFNGAGYNSPGIANEVFNIPIHRTFEFFSPVSTGTSGWETKVGNIWMSTVSDSSVTPNPTMTYTTRLFYQILKPTGNGQGQ
jgi:hypothetical protein